MGKNYTGDTAEGICLQYFCVKIFWRFVKTKHFYNFVLIKKHLNEI